MQDPPLVYAGKIAIACIQPLAVRRLFNEKRGGEMIPFRKRLILLGNSVILDDSYIRNPTEE